MSDQRDTSAPDVTPAAGGQPGANQPSAAPPRGIEETQAMPPVRRSRRGNSVTRPRTSQGEAAAAAQPQAPSQPQGRSQSSAPAQPPASAQPPAPTRRARTSRRASGQHSAPPAAPVQQPIQPPAPAPGQGSAPAPAQPPTGAPPRAAGQAPAPGQPPAQAPVQNQPPAQAQRPAQPQSQPQAQPQPQSQAPASAPSQAPTQAQAPAQSRAQGQPPGPGQAPSQAAGQAPSQAQTQVQPVLPPPPAAPDAPSKPSFAQRFSDLTSKVTAGREESPSKTRRSEPQRSTSGRPARRARLRLTRVDPWSVMKTAFLLSIAFAVVSVVAVIVVWSALSIAGVWDSINDTVRSVLGDNSSTTFNVEDYLGTSRVVGFTLVVAVIDVLLLTAMATLGAFLYNLAAALLGGIELTLAEEDR